MKIEVEIDESLIPEGYEVERIGVPRKGEEYLETGMAGGYTNVTATFDYRTLVCAIIRKKQPTYAERQAAWVKEHGIKPGSKVRVTRVAASHEDGWGNTWERLMSSSVGETLTVVRLSLRNNGIQLLERGGYVFPYFVLEPVKEPEYVPYNFHTMPLCGIKCKEKATGNLTVLAPMDETFVYDRSTEYQMNYEVMMDKYTHLDGTPCGVKVGA